MRRMVMLGWLSPGLLGTGLLLGAALFSGCEDQGREPDPDAKRAGSAS